MDTRYQTASRKTTYLGLAIALMGIWASSRLLSVVFGAETIWLDFLKELVRLGLWVLLLWMVAAKERLPLRSIGWGTSPLWKSLAWGVAGFLLSALAGGVGFLLDAPLHLHFTLPGDDTPLWFGTLIALVAGIVEETFFRGYAMERIKTLTGSTLLAWLLPLGVFASLHLYLGWAGVLNAFCMGLVMAALYWWRRDLLGNMISHALVDLTFVVLFPWLAR